jgi:hypothetical protein
MGASVKVMLSYDYCHFEFSKSTDEDVSNEQLDNMRKECMRLADKAIAQYKIAKNHSNQISSRTNERDDMWRRVKRTMAKPECDRTIGEIAEMKAYGDRNWEEYISELYNYEDGR